jgi:predicted unusual protein kinase regulating ubiquinone biosynthesis (AarF/ABC1/UbiB family)
MSQDQPQDKLPTSKIERAARFLKTGLKVGANYAKHYGQKALFQNPDRAELERANATDIFDGFSQLRGSALKVAQMLSLDTINFSQSFTTVMQKAQYSVPPMSAPLAVQAFKNSIGKSPEAVFSKFNPNAHKAASMGQVHLAEKDGKRLAVKIQYPGVADSVKSDLNMVKGIAPRIMNTPLSELQPYFEEIEARLLDEADYKLELKNSLAFKNECKDLKGILFPEYFPELSSDRVITMEWMDGLHLKEFLETQPSDEIRHKAAKAIWDFYEFQIHVLRKVNADPHPGNFLFRPDGTVVVLDFGCTKVLSDQLYNDYFTLAEPYLFDDKSRARETLFRLQILRPTDGEQKIAYLTGLFAKLITEISRPYHQGMFDFNDELYYENFGNIALEISRLRELRGSKEFLFLNRTYYGLFTMFKELDVELETACQYKNFLKKELAEKYQTRAQRAGKSAVLSVQPEAFAPETQTTETQTTETQTTVSAPTHSPEAAEEPSPKKSKKSKKKEKEVA